MRRITNILILLLTVFSALLLLLSYLSVYVNPSFIWIFGMAGLAYPFLLLINLGFLVYWIISWKWQFLIPFIAILMGIAHFSSFFQFPYGKKSEPLDEDLKVISYNVNLFHLYSWSSKDPTYEKIFSFISNEMPDIVCLQEFYVANDEFSERNAREILPFHVHVDYIVNRKNSAYGLATYSRYPIINTGKIRFENSSNACIYTDIIVEHDTIRIYNNHLQSLKFKEQNFNFLMDYNYRKDAKAISEIKDISIRYRDALQKRARQVDIVTTHMADCPYPIIVCGDFNDSPISYNYRQMKRNMRDAFIEAGSGVGHTYKGFSPSFRIDYILYEPFFKATSYRSPRIIHSDHYPVIATLRKLPKQNN